MSSSTILNSALMVKIQISIKSIKRHRLDAILKQMLIETLKHACMNVRMMDKKQSND